MSSSNVRLGSSIIAHSSPSISTPAACEQRRGRRDAARCRAPPGRASWPAAGPGRWSPPRPSARPRRRPWRSPPRSSSCRRRPSRRRCTMRLPASDLGDVHSSASSWCGERARGRRGRGRARTGRAAAPAPRRMPRCRRAQLLALPAGAHVLGQRGPQAPRGPAGRGRRSGRARSALDVAGAEALRVARRWRRRGRGPGPASRAARRAASSVSLTGISSGSATATTPVRRGR